MFFVQFCPATIFNPSILEIDDNFLLVYRADFYEFDGKKRVDGPQNGAFLGFAELNSNFELLNTPYILSHVPYPSPLSRIHDPRIIKFKDKVYCTFCRQEDLFSIFSPQEPAMYIGEISKVGDHYTLKTMLKLVPPIFQSAEKNWSPFIYQDEFYYVYLLEPYKIILKVNLENGFTEVASQERLDIGFPFGSLRGGTPLVRINDNNEYLSFSHTSVSHNDKRSYFMLAVILQVSGNSFEIKKISPFPIGNELIGRPDSLPFHAIFPSGLVIRDNEVIVSCGKNDRDMLILTLDKEKLFSSMIPFEN